jgi:ribosomal protein S18 acetylase RimI-like enzyme
MTEYDKPSVDLMVTLKSASDPALEKFAHDKIRAFNNRHSEHHLRARTGGVDPLYVLLKNQQGEIEGALTASTYWGWLDIDNFWLGEAVRGRGWGRTMLAMAEAEARTRGCLRAQLSTFGFQARGFYEKQGYYVVGTLEDYPPGGAIYWMRKDFSP